MGELSLTKPISTAEGEDDDQRYDGRGKKHKGIDYPAVIGISVVASESGQVVRASFNEGGYGNVIIIYHNPGKPDPGYRKSASGRFVQDMYIVDLLID